MRNNEILTIDKINVSLVVYEELVKHSLNEFSQKVELADLSKMVTLNKGNIFVNIYIKAINKIDKIKELVKEIEKRIYDNLFYFGSVKTKNITIRVTI